MPKKRKRITGPIKQELLKKSKEAALTAVQIFNNPHINFKSESYIVLMIIAWTYLMHAYFREKNIEYRYHKQQNLRKKYDKTKHGAFKYWNLKKCLENKNSPIDNDSKNNLNFLIGLRNEIEHRMTKHIDDTFIPQFQACCLNYNEHIKKLFSNDHGIEKHLPFSLQFSTISKGQKELLDGKPELLANIDSYIHNFDNGLTENERLSTHYKYRIFLTPLTANRGSQADIVMDFTKGKPPPAYTGNKYAFIKETDRTKYLPGQIAKIMQAEGYSKFKIHQHTQFWKKADGKNESHGFGTLVAGKIWHWYECWVDEVRKHCRDNEEKYK